MNRERFQLGVCSRAVRFQFGVCSRAVRLPSHVPILLLSALGCAHPRPPAAEPRLAYPGGRPRDSAAPLTAPAGHPLTFGAGPGDPGRSAAPEEPSSALLADARPSFGSEPFAGAGPLLFEQASTRGSWVLACRARKDGTDDRFERYLLTPGNELPIDGLLSTDPSQRYALVSVRGRTLLWDSERDPMLDLTALGADDRLSAESFAELRALSFDSSSEHLLYVRSSEQGQRVVSRALEDGVEREFDPGPGLIWRAHFDPGGVYAVLEMISLDSNKNGKLDFPAPLLATPRPCRASPGRFHAWPARGDRPEVVLLPLSGGAAIHEPELVMPIQSALLVRDANGALLLERAGKRRLLEPAACQGRVVHADAQRELFIIGCTQKKTPSGNRVSETRRVTDIGRVSLELLTEDQRRALNIELASVDLDREASDSERLVALYPGSETVLFDADRRELVPLQPGDVVLATRASHALIRRATGLLFYDADTRSELALPITLEKYPEILVSAPFAFVSPALVNLDTAALVGLTRLRPLALSDLGRLLVADEEPDSTRLIHGPLRWVLPSL